MPDGGGVALRSPRGSELRVDLRVLRDPTSDLHAQATSSHKGRRGADVGHSMRKSLSAVLPTIFWASSTLQALNTAAMALRV